MKAVTNLPHQMIFTSDLRYCLDTINIKIEKVGNLLFKLLGPYVVSDITKKGLVKSKNKNDKDLKKRD